MEDNEIDINEQYPNYIYTYSNPLRYLSSYDFSNERIKKMREEFMSKDIDEQYKLRNIIKPK
jgi:hypothetical protein